MVGPGGYLSMFSRPARGRLFAFFLALTIYVSVGLNTPLPTPSAVESPYHGYSWVGPASDIVREYLNARQIPSFVENTIPSNLPEVFRDGVKLAYLIALDGIVLLKNNNTLPLSGGERVAVFGSAQHWSWNYHCGGSSFVELPEERVVTLLEGLINAGFSVDQEVVEKYSSAGGGDVSFTEDEMYYFARRNDVAVVVIGRFTTEGRDMSEGGFYLSRSELDLIDLASRYFRKTIVVLNTAGPVDVSWDNPRIGAILWVGYPGEQGGNAVAALMLGLTSPSGRTVDTWAWSLEDYPSTSYFGRFTATYWEDVYVGYRFFYTFNAPVAYPFGYGLSYTRFNVAVENIAIEKTTLRIQILVENVGEKPGREVVQVYVSKPDGRVEKPLQELVAFAKTDVLKPGESQRIVISFDVRELKSYDESEKAWILDPGDYVVMVGTSSRKTRPAAILALDQLVLVEKTLNRMHAPAFTRLNKTLGGAATTVWGDLTGIPRLVIDPGVIETAYKTSLTQAVNSPFTITPSNTSEPVTLRDVWLGRRTLTELVAQLSVEEMVNLTIGLRGNPLYEIPELTHADGPNGLRSGPTPNPGGVAYPAAPLLASTWDVELAFIYGLQIGREMLENGITLWLGPGVNIHRNPLGGRNAEYYSEDPVLTGVIGAAVVKGVQSNHGVGAVVKHFVGNEQEFNRFNLDSIISERALREIYLRPFEIIVKTADPWSVMTSYNKVNGVYTGNDPNLLQGILRYEWGFNGFVMTDWGSGSYNYRAYYAGNDALMPYYPEGYSSVLSQVKEALNRGEISIGFLQRSLINILNVTMRSRAFALTLGVDQSEVYVYTPPSDFISVEKEMVPAGETETPVETTTTMREEEAAATTPPLPGEAGRESLLIPALAGGAVALVLISIWLVRKKR
ncbi:MAG: glycoside hydrolase family 3 C-terminal domain-containing protein [Thermosphaera sp.]